MLQNENNLCPTKCIYFRCSSYKGSHCYVKRDILQLLQHRVEVKQFDLIVCFPGYGSVNWRNFRKKERKQKQTKMSESIFLVPNGIAFQRRCEP